jgi:hypothetical protein
MAKRDKDGEAENKKAIRMCRMAFILKPAGRAA